MMFYFISLVLDVGLPILFLLVLTLLRRSIFAKRHTRLLSLMDIISVIMLIGILIDVYVSTPNGLNPLTARVGGTAQGWHVLTVVALTLVAAFMGMKLKSFLYGALAAWFAVGLHEILWFVCIFTSGFLHGDGGVSMIGYLTNVGTWYYFSIVFPILPFFVLFFKVNWKRILPAPAVFFAAWTLVGFQNSSMTAFQSDVTIAMVELVSWVLTFGVVYLFVGPAKNTMDQNPSVSMLKSGPVLAWVSVSLETIFSLN